jgi:creatinine amidohydrolase
MAKKRGSKAGASRIRTRFYDSLSDREVAAYLKRNDLIFIPVGTVEMHGEMPLGCEHVLPMAFAVKLAEQLDGLVLPNLAYFYCGGTAIGKGTVFVSPSTGVAYLKEICRSLMRAGFRRQVLLTAHGPACVTLMPTVRELFDETKCPICYLDLCTYMNLADEKGPGKVDFNKLIWGAYETLGRLDEVSVKPLGHKRAEYPPALAKIQQGRAYVGFQFSDETQHGWWPEKRLSAAARKARAAEGILSRPPGLFVTSPDRRR